MPTERSLTTAICTEISLIVAGGLRKGERLVTVEVMDKQSCQWSTAASLPQPIHRASASICCDRIYLLGAGVSKSVHSCLYSVNSCSLARKLHIKVPVALLMSCGLMLLIFLFLFNQSVSLWSSTSNRWQLSTLTINMWTPRRSLATCRVPKISALLLLSTMEKWCC